MKFLQRFESPPPAETLDIVSLLDQHPPARLREILPAVSERTQELGDHIRRVWRACSTQRDGYPEDYDQGPNVAIYCNDFRWKLLREWIETKSGILEEDVQQKIEELAEVLLEVASVSVGHFENLNDKLSEHLFCIFKTDMPEAIVFNRVYQVLSRLPKTVPKVDLYSLGMDMLPMVWPGEYLIASSDGHVASEYVQTSSQVPWEDLKVVSRMSDTTIIVAIQLLIAPEGATNVAFEIHKWLNLVSKLIDQIIALSTSDTYQKGMGKHVLLAYLWAEWQRSKTLLMYYVLGNELTGGNDERWTDILALRGNSLIAVTSRAATVGASSNHVPKSICTWAFELLKASRSSLGQDFKIFHERFSDLHGCQPARCLFGSGTPCDGSHPLACGRFTDKRLVANEQSVHKSTCTGNCGRLLWDQASYRGVSGARAVLLSRKPKSIQYCKASGNTMAVSHVWSHGQGGRPSTGINRCLHDRYCEIARQQGCDSYWIDTVCIPEDHDLRKEAISYINKTFSESKITLACDKDFWNVDVTDATSNVNLLESIVATFLVCDWNVRAWTLLEGYRSNHRLHLLCKNDRIISLREVWARVYLEGRIDLAVLSLAARHLLPRHSDHENNGQYRKDVGHGGSLLSHRHASREGDDIVIWTLLSDFQTFETAKSMWQHRIKRRIKTGYLMTKTDRLQHVRGFSWAPNSPYVRQPRNMSGSPTNSMNLSFDGVGSEEGLVTAKGLHATWLVYDLNDTGVKYYGDSPESTLAAEKAFADAVQSGSHAHNICWQTAASLQMPGRWVRLLQAKSSSSAEPYRAASDRGESHGPLLAICVSDNYLAEDECWLWKGVYEWPKSAALPLFAIDDLLLV